MLFSYSVSKGFVLTDFKREDYRSFCSILDQTQRWALQHYSGEITI